MSHLLLWFGKALSKAPRVRLPSNVDTNVPKAKATVAVRTTTKVVPASPKTKATQTARPTTKAVAVARITKATPANSKTKVST